MQTVTFSLAMLLIATSAHARSRQAQPQQDALETMAIEAGQCRQLFTLQDDKSSKCTGKLLNTTWRSGRAGFYFMTSDDEAVTFSGMGDGQIHPNPDVAIQPVDRVIFGSSHETQKAVGSCRFTNPYHGKATVDCEAVTEVGSFRGSFVTDGSEPSMKHF